MIYTVTMNPALDRTVWVRSIEADQANRIVKEIRYAGGKGIDVSKVLTNLGTANIALGLVGGFSGEELNGRLLNEGIECEFTKISGETRTNIIIHDMENDRQLIFNAEGPEVHPYELMQLVHKIEHLTDATFLIISGSLPPGVHPEIYRALVKKARSNNIRVVLDADGAALSTGIQGLPNIIKPNIHELGRYLGRTVSGPEEALQGARTIRQQGIEIVLVSLGAQGMLLVGEEELLATPPKIAVRSTIGAGDSAVAGFVYGLNQGRSQREALRFAVAAGTATVMQVETALCQKTDFQQVLPQVLISAL